MQSGQQAGLDFQFNMRLDAASVPQKKRALDGPAVDLDASGLASVDLANLATDPRVVVEARMRALPGSLLAGFGAAFDVAGTPTDMWRLRSAFPGAVDFTDTKYPGDELGELVRSGVIDPDLFLRVELVDTAGNASVRRPTFTSDPAAAPLVPVEVPTVVAPPAGGGTGGASFALDVTDVLDGSLAPTGLYRVTLLAANGRRWRLWAQDGAGATLRLWAPPIAAAGGTPLVAGPIVAVADVVTWPGLDVALFLWSDLPRELDVLASAAPITFSQP